AGPAGGVGDQRRDLSVSHGGPVRSGRAKHVRQQSGGVQDVAAVRIQRRRARRLGNGRAPAGGTMNDRPCLLWSVSNGSSAGNVLRTGALARVLEQIPELHVVVLSPLSADPVFTREFAHPRVSFEPLAPHVPSGLEARLLGVIQARYLENRQ